MRLYRDGQQKGKIRWKYNIKRAAKKPNLPASKEKNENSIKGSFVYEYEEEEKLREFKSHWFARYIKAFEEARFGIMPSNKFSQKTEVYNTYTHIIRMHKWIHSRGVIKKHDKNSGKPTKGIWGVYCANSIKKIFIIQ